MKPLRTKIVGLLLVIAGGIGYGMKTAYNRLKKDQVGTENQD